jgi:hypothetical protein
MMLFVRTLAAALILLPLSVLADDRSAAHQPVWGDRPAWVVETGVPPLDAAGRARLIAHSGGGVLYRLVESQTAWQGETELHHFRIATEVTDRAGLEQAARIETRFDPVFQDLTITGVTVWRDGVALPRNDLPVEVYRREERLDDDIISGDLTAYIQVPDVRVGDIVDWSTLTRTDPAVPGGGRGVTITMFFSDPVALTQHIAHWPDAVPFALWPLVPGVTHDREDGPEGAAVTRHVFRAVHRIPPTPEADVPPEAQQAEDGLVRYGDTRSWVGLSAALARSYHPQHALPADWLARATAIAEAHPDASGRAAAALRAVQDEIRYLSLSVGLGGYLARPPDVTAASGFGDCKDKSLFLVALLDRLGIAAEVALTDLDAGHALREAPPSIHAFDHMVVRAVIDGQTVWMDPTGSHQGGDRIGRMVPPDYGHALPIRPGGAEIEAMLPSGQRTARTGIVERFAFDATGVALEVTTRFAGRAADEQRWRLATEARTELARRYLDYYVERFPGIRSVRDLAIEDDLAANVLTVTEHYHLPKMALRGGDTLANFAFSAENFTQGLSRLPGTGERRLPILTDHPREVHHRVEVVDPPIALTPPDPVKIANPAFSYAFRAEATPRDGLVLDWTYRTAARLIDPGQAAAVRADAWRVRETTSYSWDLR